MGENKEFLLFLQCGKRLWPFHKFSFALFFAGLSSNYLFFFSVTFLCLPVHYTNIICPQDSGRSPYPYSLGKANMSGLKTKIVTASVCHCSDMQVQQENGTFWIAGILQDDQHVCTTATCNLEEKAEFIFLAT